MSIRWLYNRKNIDIPECINNKKGLCIAYINDRLLVLKCIDIPYYFTDCPIILGKYKIQLL